MRVSRRAIALGMRVHHLNCCSMNPPAKALLQANGSFQDLFERGEMVAHCLLVESNDGLILIDSGIGIADVHDPERRLGDMFVGMLQPELDEKITALRQLEALGFKRDDVRHIILTHMDVDHAGGISDFPDATVHVYAAEYAAATQPDSIAARERYRSLQWAHSPKWKLYDEQGELFQGLAATRAIVDADVLLIPTTGHSAGHACVAVNSDHGWLLHCGDAYFHHDEMTTEASCPFGLSVFQKVVATDNAARVHNQGRLRALKKRADGEVNVFSAHDPVELAAFLTDDEHDAVDSESAPTSDGVP